jgi:sugar O-acyltransferase (sialic acid O-acetyltransferase NeuD family)
MKILKINRENANDDDVIVCDVLENGKNVVADVSIVIEVETTKATIEQYSDYSGFFYSDLLVGDKVKIGFPFAVISQNELKDDEWQKLLNKERESIVIQTNTSNLSDQTITKPARILIEKYNLNIESFAGLDVVTKQHCLDIISNGNVAEKQRPELIRDVERIAIIGAGTGATIAYDILARDCSKRIVQLYDDKLKGKSFLGIPVVDIIDVNRIILSFRKSEFDSVLVTLGSNIELKDKIFKELKSADIKFTNAIHPSAVVAMGVELGVGNIVAANVVFGAFTSIGDNNIISSNCVIEHHNSIGSSNAFGPNVVTSGTVNIGNKILFATGIFIEPYISIGDNSIISSGSIITKDIKDNVIVKTMISSKIVARN